MTFRLGLTGLASAVVFTGSALAADVTMTPPTGGNVVINSAPATPALVVQPAQQVKLPGLPAAAVYTQGVCHDASGTLGRCDAQVPGPSGGANVVSSDWFLAPTASGAEYDGSNLKQTVVNIPAFTADAIDQNDIQIYMRFASDVIQLPYTSYAGSRPNTIGFRVAAGKLYIARFTHDNSGAVNLSSQLQYRYVMTPRVTLGAAPTP